MRFLFTIWKILALPKKVQLWILGFRETKFLVGVAGIIVNERREILLFKHTYRNRAWGLPGGYARAGEHPRETLVREIREESGFEVSVDSALKIRTDRETSRMEIVLTGRYLSGTFRPSDEVEDARFFAFENLPVLSRSELLLVKRVLDEMGTRGGDARKGNGKNVWQRLRTRLFPEEKD